MLNRGETFVHGECTVHSANTKHTNSNMHIHKRSTYICPSENPRVDLNTGMVDLCHGSIDDFSATAVSAAPVATTRSVPSRRHTHTPYPAKNQH